MKNTNKIKIDFNTFKEFDKDCFTYSIGNLQDLVTKGVYEKIDSLVLENMPDKIFYDLVQKIENEKLRRENERKMEQI